MSNAPRRGEWAGRSSVPRSRVRDDVLLHVPSARDAPLGHAQIWKRIGRWSQSSVRLALVELDQQGMIESRLVIARNGVPMRVYWARRALGALHAAGRTRE